MSNLTQTKLPLIVGNWKMNHSPKEAHHFLEELFPRLRFHSPSCQIGIAPQTLAIPGMQISLSALKDPKVESPPLDLYAQNSHWSDDGAFTGETSPKLLKEMGVFGVILGHSERRHLFYETNEMVKERLLGALQNNLRIILCVGETLTEREGGKMEGILKAQLETALREAPKPLLGDLLTIAYEPVWAIGTGRTASLDQVTEAHTFIQSTLEALLGKPTASNCRILYGGSVKPENAKEIMALDCVQGLLVGGASLKAESFAQILGAAS